MSITTNQCTLAYTLDNIDRQFHFYRCQSSQYQLWKDKLQPYMDDNRLLAIKSDAHQTFFQCRQDMTIDVEFIRSIGSQDVPKETLDNLLLQSISSLLGLKGGQELIFYPVFYKARQRDLSIPMLVGVNFDIKDGILRFPVNTFCFSTAYCKVFPRQVQRRRASLKPYRFYDSSGHRLGGFDGVWWKIGLPNHKNRVVALNVQTIEKSKIGKILALSKDLASAYGGQVQLVFNAELLNQMVEIKSLAEPKYHFDILHRWLAGIEGLSIVNYSESPDMASGFKGLLVSQYPALTEKAHIDRYFNRRNANLLIVDPPSEDGVRKQQDHYHKLYRCHPQSVIQCVTSNTVSELLRENGAQATIDRIMLECVVKDDLFQHKSSFNQLIGDWKIFSPPIFLQSLSDQMPPDYGYFLLQASDNQLYCRFELASDCHLIELTTEQDVFFEQNSQNNDSWLLFNDFDGFAVTRTEIVGMPDLGELMEASDSIEQFRENGFPDGVVQAFINSVADIPALDKQRLELLSAESHRDDKAVRALLNVRSPWTKQFNQFLYQHHGMRFFYPFQAKGEILEDVQFPLFACENHDRIIYCCGKFGSPRNKMASFNHFYEVESTVSADATQILSMLDATFIREGSLSALPWPIKYLREYIRHYCLVNDVFLSNIEGEPLSVPWL